MRFNTISEKMDQYISPLANKLSQQRHLKATRDAFMSMLPITLFGSIPIILKRLQSQMIRKWFPACLG